MYKFGRRSRNKLNTCHSDIQIVLNQAIKYFDFSVICGYRTAREQKKLYLKKATTLNGINKKSKHQSFPSKAVDIVPYKKGLNPWGNKEKNLRRYYYMMGIIKGLSLKLYDEGKISHKFRFGLDWDSDDRFDDQNFDDLPHFEICDNI